ncbi:MAG: GerMN domain-containing protein [Acidimicrobiales bacterium]|nr:GerMN domain-containing protein [Acidimicrobiales bacterium]
MITAASATQGPKQSAVVLMSLLLVLGAACSRSDRDEVQANRASTLGSTFVDNPGSGTKGSTTVGAVAKVPMAVPYWLYGASLAAGQPRPIPPDAEPVQFALDILIGGPNDAEVAAGLHSDVRGAYYSLAIEGETAIVDFTRAFQTANTRPQVAQVVYTLTQFDSVTQVKFKVDGTDNGATGVPPQRREEMDDMLPTVLVESPYPAQEVGSSFKLAGTTTIVDAEVHWRVEGPDGTQVAEGTARAQPARSTGNRGKLLQEIVLPTEIKGSVVLVIPQRNPSTGYEPPPTRIPLTVT